MRFRERLKNNEVRLCGLVDFMATDSEVLGLILDTTIFSEK
jgi:hypothetical protein